MVNTNTYCAICGGPAHDIDLESYGKAKWSESSLEWLRELNILGRPNKRASPPRSVPFNDPETSAHLWKNDLPPRELQILPARNGVIDCDITRDDLIMESLIFGIMDEDLGKITAVGVDAQFRGFEVCYSNGESRTIGHTNAMQYFPIDGAGGERILYVNSKISFYPSGIQFLTNRGRHFTVAKPDPMREIIFPKQGPGHRRDVLMGFYCHWSNRHTPGTDFITIGGFSRKFKRPVDEQPLRAMDAQQEHFWTPDPPLPGVLTVGSPYGYREFLRPPSTFVRKREQPELEQKPHYTEDEWDVQGSHLKCLQLWVDDQMVLSGLQFIAKDGRESPAWGSCVGENPIRMRLQAQKKNRAAGLKFFVDEMGRDVTRDDFVVVGVQLIGFRKE
ncbi:hypothetical protein FANTH_416 [Fusarium anthophilum]|uniref:Uncharacterized protein n=1 Tax=Fusarium anthophilum TaxID=48485 RepID=A0A8H4ZYQ4_9HYPO|nr:hypothetical protein FANTH_416 [Fusarium anthophilum]